MGAKEIQFKELFKENKDRVYRICCSYVKNENNRQDLFQEIFINVWKNLSTFRNESHINTWIYRISINSAINFCRLQNRVDKPCQEMNGDFIFEGDTDLKNKIALETELQQMFHAINRLTVSEKSIISLVLEGLDHASIAKICGMTEGNVRVKFHRIKKNIKKIMEEK